jgi:hypothetical protein
MPNSSPHSHELDVLIAAAASLLSSAKSTEEVEAAGRIVQQVSEIEQKIAEAEKNRVERDDLKVEKSTSAQRIRSDERKHFAALLAPLLTTGILAGTLILQTYQAVTTETDRRIEQQQAADAAEDIRWGETLKALAGETQGISPGALRFVTFVNSKRYGALARQTAQSVLVESKNIDQFKQLFGVTYGAVNWNDLPSVLDLDRRMGERYDTVIRKYFNNQPLSPEEAVEDAFYNGFVSYMCDEIAALLRTPRPTGRKLDLSYVGVTGCSFSGADMRDADLNGFDPTAVDFSNVDFTGAKNYTTAVWAGNIWWHARKMNPEMARFLKEHFPFDPNANYGSGHVSKEDYDEAIKRIPS